MDFKFKTKKLWQSAKECTVAGTRVLSNGITFKEVFNVYANYVRIIIPSAIEHITDLFVAFFLFHFYLAYVLIFCVAISIFKRFKMKGSKIVPDVGLLKEKAGVALTYFFVLQSVSRWTLGMPALDKLMGWAFQVRPQLNFRPQIKIAKSNSNESVVSVKSKYGTGLGIGFESDDESVRDTCRSIQQVSRGVDFARDLVDACDVEKIDKIPEDQSITLVQKWLEDQESTDSKTVNTHLLKLVAQDVMRRRSFMPVKEKEEVVE